MPPTPDWNAVRFAPGASAGHVESYFWKLNEPGGRRALWLKATILRRIGAEPVAEGWAVAFDRERGHVGAKQVVAWTPDAFSRAGLDVAFASLRFGHDAARGELRSDAARIAWDLALHGEAPPVTPLPRRLYDEHLPTGKLVTPRPDLRFDGYYELDDERVPVLGWPGMQGHNWGRRHPHAYGWGHCNAWDDAEDLVLEGITARLALGPLVTPPATLLVVDHGGERLAFPLWRARGRAGPRSWEFRAEARGARLAGRFVADTADFAGLHYENPDGAMTYCLNSKIARGELRLERSGRPALVAHTRAAALEIGTRDPGHGVKMLA